MSSCPPLLKTTLVLFHPIASKAMILSMTNNIPGDLGIKHPLIVSLVFLLIQFQPHTGLLVIPWTNCKVPSVLLYYLCLLQMLPDSTWYSFLIAEMSFSQRLLLHIHSRSQSLLTCPTSPSHCAVLWPLLFARTTRFLMVGISLTLLIGTSQAQWLACNR